MPGQRRLLVASDVAHNQHRQTERFQLFEENKYCDQECILSERSAPPLRAMDTTRAIFSSGTTKRANTTAAMLAFNGANELPRPCVFVIGSAI